MKFKDFNKEVVGYLLEHLAKCERFESAKALGIESSEVAQVLRELASHISQLTEETVERPRYDDLSLSPKAMALISCLSPHEEAVLFKSFRLT